MPRKMSASHSECPEQSNQTTLEEITVSETTASQETNKRPKEQTNLTVYEPQIDQLFSISGMCKIVH